MLTDLAINLAASLLYDFGKTLFNRGGKSELVARVLDQVQPSTGLHDFPERYVEALVELRMVGKPPALFYFLAEEKVMDAYYQFYYSPPEQRFDQAAHAARLQLLARELPSGQRLAADHADSAAELAYFGAIFSQKVHESRPLREVELIQLIRKLQDSVDDLAQLRSALDQQLRDTNRERVQIADKIYNFANLGMAQFAGFVHDKLPEVRLPLPGASVQAINLQMVKKAAHWTSWQRWCFRWVVPFADKIEPTLQALRWLDHNEIAQFQQALTAYQPMQCTNEQGLKADFYTTLQRRLDGPPSAGRFFLLLGETGIGKSTALAHLLVRLATGRRRRKVVLAHFGRDLEAVYQLPEPENTILLLDGIDEAPEAIQDADAFFTAVEARVKNFAKVVIGCRKQFFANQATERRQTRTSPPNPYQRYTLEPLTEAQVQDWLREKFPEGRAQDDYAMGLAIARQSNELFFRPLLLPYLQEMVEQRGRFLFFDEARSVRYTTITSYEIYHQIIRQWMEREERAATAGYAAWLWEASLDLARRFYQQEQQGNPSALYYLDLQALPVGYTAGPQDKLLQARSLLHRNEAGYFRFVHRSFKEFFYAQCLYLGLMDETSFPFDRYEDTDRFYREMCEVQYFQRQPPARRHKHIPGKKATTFRLPCRAVDTFAQLELPAYASDSARVYTCFDAFFTAAREQGHLPLLTELASQVLRQHGDTLPEAEVMAACARHQAQAQDLLGYFFWLHHPTGRAFSFLHRAFAEFLALDTLITAPAAHRHAAIAAFDFPQLRFAALFADEIKWLQLWAQPEAVEVRVPIYFYEHEHLAGSPWSTWLAQATLSVDAYASFCASLRAAQLVRVRCKTAAALASLPAVDAIEHLNLAHLNLRGVLDLRAFGALHTLNLSGNPELVLEADWLPSSLLHITDTTGATAALAGLAQQRPKLKLTVHGDPAVAWHELPNSPPEMVAVQGGVYWRGDDANPESDEYPAHPVRVADFCLGKYPVTVGEFAAFVAATGYVTEAEREGASWAADWYNNSGTNTLTDVLHPDCHWRHNAYGEPLTLPEELHLPVLHVSWLDAVAFCNWRSAQDGLTPVYEPNGNDVTVNWAANGYRLPTEAEWEYAALGGPLAPRDEAGVARAAYEYAGSDNLDEVGWYFGKWSSGSGNKRRPQPVGKLAPNQLGIYDLSGQVWEWCHDWYDATYYAQCATEGANVPPTGPAEGLYRVVRGGSWSSNAGNCRIAFRLRNSPDYRDNFLGFRLLFVPQ